MIAWPLRVATSLVLGVGVVHTAGTFIFFDALAEPAIWFAGAGLGGIFVSAQQRVAVQLRRRWPRHSSRGRLRGASTAWFAEA